MNSTSTPDTNAPAQPYIAEEVAEILRVGVPTVYEWSRLNPEAIGAFRVGRAVRFRRNVIDGLVNGAR
jgi:excisionase family DNA binding protein